MIFYFSHLFYTQSMKPKLIILNGPSGIGKNTIAELYKNEYPTSLVLDMDELRRTVPNYKEQREESYKKSCDLVFVKSEEHLVKGFNVVIPNKIKRDNVLDKFKEIADKCNADFYEFVLWTTKEDAINRAVKRGFKPGSLLQEDKLSGMYDELEEIIKTKNNSFIIVSKEGEPEETYREIIDKLI